MMLQMLFHQLVRVFAFVGGLNLKYADRKSNLSLLYPCVYQLSIHQVKTRRLKRSARRRSSTEALSIRVKTRELTNSTRLWPGHLKHTNESPCSINQLQLLP